MRPKCLFPLGVLLPALAGLAACTSPRPQLPLHGVGDAARGALLPARALGMFAPERIAPARVRWDPSVAPPLGRARAPAPPPAPAPLLAEPRSPFLGPPAVLPEPLPSALVPAAEGLDLGRGGGLVGFVRPWKRAGSLRGLGAGVRAPLAGGWTLALECGVDCLPDPQGAAGVLALGLASP